MLDKVTFVAAPVRATPRSRATAASPPTATAATISCGSASATPSSDDGTVQVVRPGGKVVYTLARDRFLKRYHFHTFYWDGRQHGGGTAAPGRYKLRVAARQERTLVTARGRSACTGRRSRLTRRAAPRAGRQAA